MGKHAPKALSACATQVVTPAAWLALVAQVAYLTERVEQATATEAIIARAVTSARPAVRGTHRRRRDRNGLRVVASAAFLFGAGITCDAMLTIMREAVR